MIDWGLVLKSSIWLAGLSMILALSSLASYNATRAAMPLRVLVALTARSAWTLSGALLFCAGMILTSASLPEAVLWALLAASLTIAWATLRGYQPPDSWYRVRSRHRPVLRLSSPLLARILDLELLWLIFFSPFFLFPGTGGPAILTVALLPLLWIIRRLVRGHFVPATPLDWPIFFMMVMVLVSLFVTFDPAFSLSKVTGVLLGIGVYYAIVGLISGAHDALKRAITTYSVAGLLVALVGILATNWSAKFNFLAGLVGQLPTFLTGLPGAESGINPNETAGALLWILPMQIVFVRITWSRLSNIPGRPLAVLTLSGALILAATSAALLLVAESRASLAGLAVGLVVLFASLLPRNRRGFITIGAVVGALLVTVLLAGRVLGSVGTGFGLSDLLRSAQSRAEIWSRALYGIRDFPFTGMGMNTFRRLMPSIYPSSLPPGYDVAHAHNTFLQVALDLGLPGLVAYTALLLLCAALLVDIWRNSQEEWVRWAAGGIAAGLLAYSVFGLIDTVALGAKPGVFFWALLAILTAAWQQTRSITSRIPQKQGGSNTNGRARQHSDAFRNLQGNIENDRSDLVKR